MRLPTLKAHCRSTEAPLLWPQFTPGASGTPGVSHRPNEACACWCPRLQCISDPERPDATVGSQCSAWQPIRYPTDYSPRRANCCSSSSILRCNASFSVARALCSAHSSRQGEFSKISFPPPFRPPSMGDHPQERTTAWSKPSTCYHRSPLDVENEVEQLVPVLHRAATHHPL